MICHGFVSHHVPSNVAYNSGYRRFSPKIRPVKHWRERALLAVVCLRYCLVPGLLPCAVTCACGGFSLKKRTLALVLSEVRSLHSPVLEWNGNPPSVGKARLSGYTRERLLLVT